MFVSSNEYFAASSLIYLHGDNIEDSEKQYWVSDTSFETIIPSIKKNFFHPRMMDFVNKLEISGQKYQTNENVRDENYKGKLLFSMK